MCWNYVSLAGCGTCICGLVTSRKGWVRIRNRDVPMWIGTKGYYDSLRIQFHRKRMKLLYRKRKGHVQGRIQDFKLGGAHLKFVWGISCEKSRFYANKSYFSQLRREARKLLGYFVWKITILRQKIIFFPILGGRAGAPPPGSAPACIPRNLTVTIQHSSKLYKFAFFFIYIYYHSVILVILFNNRNLIDCLLFLSVARIF